MSGDAGEPAAGSSVGRRVILGMLGASALGVVWGSRLEGLVDRVVPGNGGGLLSVLPAGRFRIYSVTHALPDVSAAEYRLRIHGLVARPVELTLADLRSHPPTTLRRDFQCVTGWRVQSVAWRGVPLSRLLDEAGVRPQAAACRFVSFDGAYSESLTLEQARRDDVIVAYEMAGKSLTRAHGGPARLYVAPMYGYKSCKWLSEIVVGSEVVPGYWEELGYDVEGWVGRSNGRRDRPT